MWPKGITQEQFDEFCWHCKFKVENISIIGGGAWLCGNPDVLKRITWNELNTREKLGISIAAHVGLSAAVPLWQSFLVCQTNNFVENLSTRIVRVLRQWLKMEENEK